MNPLVLQMVNHKLNTIKKDELIQLAKQYNFKVTETQAKKIITILRSETIDVTNMTQRERILAKIKQQVDANTEKQMNAMLKQYDHYL
ncbi:DUF2624 family protein [Anaerobacillus isosaccharinicus]|uniref:DUF2624 family protein n=1 Tax=Anaerobacillus isosaccharinicus TaxID=1532552 RepID=A0A1S2LS63_9BACI|nr:DUF2624 family protein [Anaerobacillus isosaccharinicus]MBA5585522.1 DUF2624 family protein [Anaerobacillus isosaccharinicus]QOY36164.1 DUF2624 family protein [Anaerobacillus isosaccharinicus]